MTFKFLNKDKDGANLQATIEALNIDKATLKKQYDDLLASIGGVDVQAKLAELETSKASIAALTTERDTFKAQVDTYNKDVAALIGERDTLKLQLEEANKKYSELEQQKAAIKAEEVNKAASAKLAAKGVKDGEIPAAPNTISHDSKEIMAQIKSLRAKGLNKEADALYKKNRALFVK